MVDATISMVLKRLAPLIEKKVREEVNLLLNAEKDARDLSSKLKKIHEVLADAERRVLVDRRVENWLQKLRDIAYEIDDALDEWEVENIKQYLEESEDDSNQESEDSWEKKVSSILESICLCFKQTVQRRSIALDIKAINQRLDSIAKENEDEFKFLPNVGGASRDFKRVLSTSFVDVSEVHGRDLDRDNLMSVLLSESSGQGGGYGDVKIVSIVGAGGMGKTTLAQLVFNDVLVKNQFEEKIWVCVSDPFDEIKIAKAILEAVTKRSPNLSQLETLLHCIEESILGKKFLLVLDDVWIEDDTVWKPLKVSLRCGAPGSRILVTTRKEKVAKVMDSGYIHLLVPLEDMYCWSVLSQIAFHERSEREREILKETGREIANKCKGLPLAAKTIGGVLRFKTSLEEWQGVLKSEMWELEGVQKDIFPFLTLSYDELHPAVRRCFSYCAVFPKDTTMDVDTLVRIWMAHGFLSYSTSGNTKDMELIGREYFDDLAMRSFFQDFVKDDDGRITECKMHDMVHDFAQFLTNNECFIIDQFYEGANMTADNNNARHLSVNLKDVTNFDSICEYERLRTFICGYVNPPNLFTRLKRVRLMSVGRCNFQNIPEEIGDLIHLRYLDLSGNTRMTELPETICSLYNLQTLSIQQCTSLQGLPRGIHKLINLRHLLNMYISPDFKFPEGFEKLTNLRTLGDLCVMTGSSNKLGCLKDLNQLGGTLRILIDGDDLYEDDAKKAELNKKKSLRRLELVCRRIRMEIVEALQPHPNLSSLSYHGYHLPKWIATLTHLRTLIVGCLYTTASSSIEYLLSPLGQLPFLEDLCIRQMTFRHVGRDFFSTTLPKLRTLIFEDCPWWEKWEDIDDKGSTGVTVQSLKYLAIHRCGQLVALPHRLLRVKALQFLDITDCEVLKNRYSPEMKTWDELSDIPYKVVTTNT